MKIELYTTWKTHIGKRVKYFILRKQYRNILNTFFILHKPG